MDVRLRRASRHTFHNSLWPREAEFQSRKKSSISKCQGASDLTNLRASFFRMPFSEIKVSGAVITGDRRLNNRYDVATRVAHVPVKSDLKNIENCIFGEFLNRER